MKSILPNNNFILKISALLLIVALGFVAPKSGKDSDLKSSFKGIAGTKSTVLKQVFENSWFAHQAR